MPPRSAWDKLRSARERITVHAPHGVFTATEGEDGWTLASTLKARNLGPEPAYHVFAMRFRRFAKSIDALLAHPSALRGIYVDGAFPQRIEKSFTPTQDADVHPGFAARVVIADKTSYVWINGVEGYNTDYALVPLGPSDTLLVVGDWNGPIMMGQPLCYQRTILAGVIDSLAAW